MIKDKLKINDDKTQFILIGTRAQLQKVTIDSLVVGDSVVQCSCEATKNLGAWFDSHFYYEYPHIEDLKSWFLLSPQY